MQVVEASIADLVSNRQYTVAKLGNFFRRCSVFASRSERKNSQETPGTGFSKHSFIGADPPAGPSTQRLS